MSTPSCSAAGINLQTPSLFLESLGNVDPQNVTNGVMLEIFDFLQRQKKKKTVTWVDIRNVLATVFQEKVEFILPESLRGSVVKVKEKRATLIKMKVSERGSLVDNFLATKWRLPTFDHSKMKRKAESMESAAPFESCSDLLSHKVPKFYDFQNEVQEETLKKLGFEVASLTKTVDVLQSENIQLKVENAEQRKEISVLKTKLQAYNPRRVNQAMKRKDDSKETWKKKFKALSNSSKNVVQMKKKLAETKKCLSVTKSATKRKDKRREHTKLQKKELTYGNQQKTNESYIVQLMEKKTRLSEAKEDIMFLENELDVAKCKDNVPIQTKVDGKTYAPGVREASYHLQNMGVSQRHVSETIRKVTKAITGEELGDLPSYTSHNMMTKEMKALSYQQVHEGLEGAENLTLKYDGTTKKLGQMVEVEISTKTDTFLLGVRQQVNGKADSYVDTILDAIKTVENTKTPKKKKVPTATLR